MRTSGSADTVFPTILLELLFSLETIQKQKHLQSFISSLGEGHIFVPADVHTL